MIKFLTKHGSCWVEPDFIKAIYPLESELSMTESGLAEISCYLALENGETLELVESLSLVYDRWFEYKKEVPKEPGSGPKTKRGNKGQKNQKENEGS